MDIFQKLFTHETYHAKEYKNQLITYQKQSIASGIFCISISKYCCQAQYFQLRRLKCHEDCHAII